MRVNNKSIGVSEAIIFANYDHLLLKRRANSLLLSDYQVNVLKKNGINYCNYSNLHDLLFEISDTLESNYEEELDVVAGQISEILYYSETKK